MVETLLAKAKDRTAVFGVVGLGYVGLPLAMELVRAGYRVLGVDVNSRVVDSLNAGRSHIRMFRPRRSATRSGPRNSPPPPT